MNSGSVDDPGPDTNVVMTKSSKLKVNDSRNPATIAGSELREGDLAERPPGRGVQVGARLDQRPVHARQPCPDEQQHEARVEQDVGRDDRRVAEVQPDAGQVANDVEPGREQHEGR